jgi:hypothetical protein
MNGPSQPTLLHLLGDCMSRWMTILRALVGVWCEQLTELKALLGCVGQVKFVMGCISQLQDGRYFLEDMSDSLPIDLSDAQTTSGFFTGNPVQSVILGQITASGGLFGLCRCLVPCIHSSAVGFEA